MLIARIKIDIHDATLQNKKMSLPNFNLDSLNHFTRQ